MTPTDIRDTAIPEDVETFSAIDLRFQIATVAPVQAAALWAMPGVIAAMNVYFKAAIMAATEAERERCVREALGYECGLMAYPNSHARAYYEHGVTDAGFGIAQRIQADTKGASHD